MRTNPCPDVVPFSPVNSHRADERAATVADIRELHARFDLLVERLNAKEEQMWLKTHDLCKLLGCTDRHLRNLMAKSDKILTTRLSM